MHQMKPIFCNKGSEEELELGKWFTLPSVEKYSEHSLKIPIIQGEKIIVDLQYDGEIELKDSCRDEDDPAFYEENFPPPLILFLIDSTKQEGDPTTDLSKIIQIYPM